MSEFQQLASYLAGIFNGYIKKETSDDNITKIKSILDTVFPEKSSELQSEFELKFPELFGN